jgi:arylsulfatase A-like enzyme
MDVHAPYSWHDEPPGERVVVPGAGALPDALLEQRYRKQGLEGPAVHARILALYDAGVRAADAAVGELLAGLSKARPDAPRIVAITSDHGEGFREHGTTEHGWNLYPEVYAVPLILAGPGIPAALRVPAQVRSIDLAPTLLQLADADVPTSFDGEALPLSAAAGAADRIAISSLGFGGYVPDRFYVAVVSGTHLYIHERTRGARELYDLESDPRAQEPLDPNHPEAARHAAHERALELHDAEEQALDESTREALRALGYLE